jgi:hypothetical protein
MVLAMSLAVPVESTDQQERSAAAAAARCCVPSQNRPDLLSPLVACRAAQLASFPMAAVAERL